MSDYEKKRAAIVQLMEYAVPESLLDTALDVLDVYRDDRLGLTLLHEFYSFLPDTQENYIKELRLIGRNRGIFLLAAMTGSNGFLYIVSSEGVEFQGSAKEGFWHQELLDFYGFSSGKDLADSVESLKSYPVYEPLGMDSDVCPACHAETGEMHELGCPVEVCPWCGGQLIYCNCRFEKMDRDSLESEADLEELEALLNEQGRIAYGPEQRPVFPTSDE